MKSQNRKKKFYRFFENFLNFRRLYIRHTNNILFFKGHNNAFLYFLHLQLDYKNMFKETILRL
jgi:hypothetical protein